MDIKQELKRILPADRIKCKYIDIVSFGPDAGFYNLIPRAVVFPINEEEIISLLGFSQLYKIPIVFRTGGTSLSGQSITDGILIVLSQYWNKVKIENKGGQVRVQPGITGAMVNAHLKRYQRKIGPDPASINAAMMGGILSNNSSGMCCGTQYNSYHTTKYIRFILPDGKVFSTENPMDFKRFEHQCTMLFNCLRKLKNKIASNKELFQRIRKKYQTKNTVGYSLNSFIDYEHPLDILAHLLIGAEGTLAFISEAVLETIPDYTYKSTALLFFPTVYAACEAIVPITEAGAAMVELMDRSALYAVQEMEGIPSIAKDLPRTAAALLIEFQENDEERLREQVHQFRVSTNSLELMEPPAFTENLQERALLWKIRKGLFPAVGAVRARGTSVILEDVAFPVKELGNAILDLQKLFKKHTYSNAIIFGHAKDGNIHFVVTQSFSSKKEVERYDLFIHDVVALVVEKYDGTLKAEHGTGRNMAPFVETEWGGEAYEIMKEVKEVIDPHALLNPGVIINDDRKVHIKNLKEMPPVEEEIDKCIECGYCEHKCPSRNLTTSPKRRIVARRVLQQLKASGDHSNYKLLQQQFKYEGIETCAVDGLCATVCPVEIDTGDLVKRLRRENHSKLANKMALLTAKNFGLVQWAVRFGLKSGFVINKIFGKKSMEKITTQTKKIVSQMPLWISQIETPPSLSVLRKKDPTGNVGTKDTSVVYFPACITRMLGTYRGKEKNMMETFISVCSKVGIEVSILQDINSSCCGQMFSSKGFGAANNFTANKIIDSLWDSSEEGKLPIIIDVSSCAFNLQQIRPVLNNENQQRYDRLKILDVVEFLNDMVLPKSNVKFKKESIALHSVCSLEKMKTEDKFLNIAKHFAKEVMLPKNNGCCGMAGDRGFLFPELTKSATNSEKSEIIEHKCESHYSSTKTCEMALSQATNENYESILYLVDECI
ncbi:MAG: FAD-binding and (Fe-S)-binding domain-containing protein [Flavobacteriaceae bacterium]